MSKNPDLHPSHRAVLRVMKGKMRASEIADHLGIMPSVAHNRLRKLRMLSLVDRAYNGNGWEYFKTTR